MVCANCECYCYCYNIRYHMQPIVQQTDFTVPCPPVPVMAKLPRLHSSNSGDYYVNDMYPMAS